MSNDTGVYAIINTVNHKVYVGSATQGIRRRWALHRSQLHRQGHHSVKLQRAWNKYGEHAFRCITLIRCPPEDCLLYEQRFLDMMRPFYNTCMVAGSRLGTKQSDATRDKIRQSQRGRSHSKETKAKMSKQLQGMNAKLTISKAREARRLASIGKTQQQIADQFGVSRSCIKDVVNYNTWRNI